MTTLALKILVTPVLIGGASLAGRRWGPAISGWLVGLPLTSGPITFFLALSHGTPFAAATCVGVLAGTLSQAAFCLAYAHVSLLGGGSGGGTGSGGSGRRAWPAAFAGGCIAFAAATLVLQGISLPVLPLFGVVLVALLATLRLLPRPMKTAAPVAAPPGWDLPARMVVATTFVVVLTAVAPALGPHLTGLLAPFPLYASVLAIFAHRERGADAATSVLRGLQLGLFGFACFFLVLSILLVRTQIAVAFAAAIVTALAVQGASLAVMMRQSRNRSRNQADAKAA